MTVSLLPVSALLLVLVSVPAGVCAAQSIPATASGRFEALDRNRDGIVSKYEYDSESAFTALDSDNNNRITAEELQVIFGPQRYGELSTTDRLRAADDNNDGELTDEELRRVVEMRFQGLDYNRDGSLDLDEMQSGFGQ